METHPLPPFYPQGAKILMLGSFPPPRERWKINFFYPNFQNDMWRIFGWVFFRDKNYFVTKNHTSFDESLLRAFLTEKGVALWDTAMEINRQQGNASDKFLEVLRPIDLDEALKNLPECKSIVLTGKKAMAVLLDILPFDEPPIGSFSEITYSNRLLRIYRMPSSSRAYPQPVEEKALIYEKMFKETGLKVLANFHIHN
jgi:G:T/U-mismatch repair DNA glycosylase